jgi:hypothetical protein
MIATIAVLFMNALKNMDVPQKINKVERSPPPAIFWMMLEICRTPPDFSKAVPMMNNAPIVSGASFLKTSNTALESTNPKSTVAQSIVNAMRSAGAISLRKAYNVTMMSNKVRIMGGDSAIARVCIAEIAEMARRDSLKKEQARGDRNKKSAHR